MSCTMPSQGSRVSHYYVEEVTCNTTPANPAWTPIRFTSGNIQLTKDSIASSELDGSREVADIRLGQNQATGEISIELSAGAYEDLLIAALGGSNTAGGGETGIGVQVVAGTNTFTRIAGDWTTQISAGDIVKFSGFSEAGNNGAFYVVSVSALNLVVADSGKLVNEDTTGASPLPIDYTVADYFGVGTDRKTFSILTHYADADGGAGEYHLTTGVEITGYSFDVSVNAMVTGSLSTIGRTYSADCALPAGSTFNTPTKHEVFASVDGLIYENNDALGFVTSLSFTLDNAAAAQFEIGNDYAAFIERGRANTTLSLSSFFLDSTLLNKFVNETETSIILILDGSDGTMAVVFPRVVLTSGTPSVDGEASITQNFDAQALKPGSSSAVDTSVRIYSIVP